jgi:hypothetical protein
MQPQLSVLNRLLESRHLDERIAQVLELRGIEPHPERA